MTLDCHTFRRQLERALRPRADRDRWNRLSWCEHLTECADCRALLEKEEALEAILSWLPTPSLPEDLARRLLARLTSAVPERDRLDSLLELDRPPDIPEDLAQRVRAALAGARADERLDGLLARLPAPEVPDRLSARVLHGLEAHRREPSVVRLPGRFATARRRVAAAALVLAGLGALLGWAILDGEGRSGSPGAPPGARVAGTAPVDEDVLSYLGVLENWDLLVTEDLDVLLSSVEAVDEILLEWGDLPAEPAEAPAPAPRELPEEEPSRG